MDGRQLRGRDALNFNPEEKHYSKSSLEKTEHAAAELLAHCFGVTTTPPPLLSTGDLPPAPSLSAPLPMAFSPRARAPPAARQRSSRSTATASAAAGLHPVIRLGWGPLCSVICNGLKGEFLGGHDRDMYIQCTSGQFAGLPLVDASLGGCIMTCSQFERCAGRELSKKWKESIHVVGEGEGSRGTLASWLKRRAERDFGDAVMGQRVWVCWVADAAYYQGTITAFSRESGKHTVQYSSRLVEDLHLGVELISFEAEKPTLPGPPQAAAAAAAEAAEADPAAGSLEAAWAAVMRAAPPAGCAVASPLRQSGSAVSATSAALLAHADELRGSGTLAALASGVRALRTSVQQQQHQQQLQQQQQQQLRRPQNAALVRVAEGPPENLPAPKRTLSAPPAVLLAEVAAAAQAMAEQAAAAAAAQQQATPLPATPMAAAQQQKQQHQQQQYLQAAQQTLLLQQQAIQQQHIQQQMQQAAAAVALPSPPRLTDPAAPEALSAAVAWMHGVALCLDDDLSQGSAATAATPAATARPNLFLASELAALPSPAAPVTTAERSPFSTGDGTAGFASFACDDVLLGSSMSGRFQVKLGLMRATPACVQGLFEAMVRRYEHFAAATPALQRRKMAELLIAMVEATGGGPPGEFGVPSHATKAQQQEAQQAQRQPSSNTGVEGATTAERAAPDGDGSTHTEVEGAGAS